MCLYESHGGGKTIRKCKVLSSLKLTPLNLDNVEKRCFLKVTQNGRKLGKKRNVYFYFEKQRIKVAEFQPFWSIWEISLSY